VTISVTIISAPKPGGVIFFAIFTEEMSEKKMARVIYSIGGNIRLRRYNLSEVVT
jgi:hypothetical protein